MDGLLLIDKPLEWSSFDVVKKVRNLSGVKKVGHTGTLDPMAGGLLILTLGSACKKAQDYSKLDKSYYAEVTLGKTSTTGDSEGELTQVSSEKPNEDEVKKALKELSGVIEQTVPAYSAVKIDGKRAYRLAREGKQVDLPTREINIYSYDNVEYTYPVIRFEVRVSSGTYIRSLAEDIGRQLGVGGYLSSLKRTSVGEFSVQDAIPMDGLNKEKIQSHILTLENQG